MVNLTTTNKYITFTVVLLIWELIPTFVIVLLFRLKRNSWDLTGNRADWSIQSSISVRKSVFLDYTTNPDKNRFEDNDSINSDEPLDDSDNDYTIENDLLINSNNNNSHFSSGYYGSI